MVTELDIQSVVNAVTAVVKGVPKPTFWRCDCDLICDDRGN